MKTFVDTSAFYALASASDERHADATAIHERLKGSLAVLATTNYVILETVSLLQHRHGMVYAERFGDFIRDVVDVVWVDAVRHQAAWSFWKARRQRALSLVDCVSFIVMREQGIHQAFTFDKQFQEAGFEPLRPSPGDRVAEPRGVYRATHRRR